uniref:Uncharacterized protein n=1 Tax=Anguilla anguilla TaxID=7936 RepID=A0A0E9SE16_ANGAN
MYCNVLSNSTMVCCLSFYPGLDALINEGSKGIIIQ